MPYAATCAAAFALMTSQRDSTSPRKQRAPQHAAMQAAAKDGSSSRNGSTPGTGSTPSERNTQSPGGTAAVEGRQPPQAAGAAEPAEQQNGAAVTVDRRATLAAADVQPALSDSQPFIEHRPGGAAQGAQPVQEAPTGAEAAGAAGSGDQPPSSQGAGLDLNLSPQEAMLTGVRLLEVAHWECITCFAGTVCRARVGLDDQGPGSQPTGATT